MNPPVRVVVSRRFALPAEEVYDAWLEPEWIRCWVAGPDGRDQGLVRSSLEPRVGGKLSVAVEHRGAKAEHCGQYLELDRPDLLVFTWGTGDSRSASGRVIVEIVPCAGGCEVTLTHVITTPSAAVIDKTAGAWRKMLAALADARAGKTNLLILKAS